ncbi:MAG: hypothetical protein JO006_07820 [Paucibacter sp.]|nr:hypothetical protein [Roseateles sp.]
MLNGRDIFTASHALPQHLKLAIEFNSRARTVRLSDAGVNTQPMGSSSDDCHDGLSLQLDL